MPGLPTTRARADDPLAAPVEPGLTAVRGSEEAMPSIGRAAAASYGEALDGSGQGPGSRASRIQHPVQVSPSHSFPRHLESQKPVFVQVRGKIFSGGYERERENGECQPGWGVGAAPQRGRARSPTKPQVSGGKVERTGAGAGVYVVQGVQRVADMGDAGHTLSTLSWWSPRSPE